MFRLELLGGFRLTREGSQLELASRKAQLLLARVALASSNGVGRETLCGLLWEASGDAQARASLRQALAQVRRACAPLSPPLVATGDSLALDRTCASTDVDDLACTLRQEADASAVATLLRGPLLDGLVPREPAIGEWLAAERRRLAVMELQALDQAAADALQARHLSSALALAMRAVASDPLREATHRLVMRIYQAQGEPAAAVRQFKTCRDCLESELGVRPEPETIALYDEIRAARTEARPSRSSTGPSPSVSELRQAALLCVLGPPTDDPEEEVNPRNLVAAVEGVAVAHGGHAFATPGGVLVAFGVKGAHADDPERAKAAALAVLAAAPKARIGFATGRVVVDPARPDGLVGDVRRRAVAHAAAAARGTLATAPCAETAAPRSEPPFVGRAFEMQQLRMLQTITTETAQGVVALITGEPGIGKTRLVRAFAEEVRAQGGVAVTTSFQSFGRRVPIGHQIARGLADIGTELGARADRAHRAVLERMTDAGLAADSAALVSAMPRARFASLAVDVVAGLLQSVPVSPRVVIVDNAHWAETEDLALLGAIAERLVSIEATLLVTERGQSARFGPRLRRAALDLHLASIEVAPFGPADARRLASAMGVVDDAIIGTAIARAEGNVLFLVRLLEAGPEAVDHAPPSVVSLVQEQVDKLPVTQRDTLRRAAILGESFDPTNYDRAFGPADFDGLCATGLLVPDLDRMAFGHALIHEAVYGAMPRADRRALHAEAARAFKGHDAVRWADQSLAAGHGDAPEACAAAAATLLPRQQFEAGARYIETGLTQTEDPPARAPLWLARGSMRRVQGDLNGAMDDYVAVAAHGRTVPLRAQALVRKAWVHRLRGAFERADEALRAAAALPQAELSPDLRSELACQLSAQAFVRGENDRCMDHAERALELAEGPFYRSRAHAGLGEALYAVGRMRSATAAFAASSDLARTHGFGLIDVGIAVRHANSERFAAPGSATWRLAEAALDRARDADHPRAALLANLVIADIALEAAELGPGALLIATARQLAERIAAARCAFEIDWLEARLFTQQGVVQRARALLDRSIDRLSDADAPLVGAALFGQRALIAATPEARRVALHEAERLLTRGSMSHVQLWCRQVAIDALAAVGDWDGVAAQANALQAFTATEPLIWSDNLIERANLLAIAARGRAGPGNVQAARALDARLEATLQRTSLSALRAAYPDEPPTRRFHRAFAATPRSP
ncbi:MAG: BTAD domain-containing putative transcriptional regulator [Pseudomonadota bacterium]